MLKKLQIGIINTVEQALFISFAQVVPKVETRRANKTAPYLSPHPHSNVVLDLGHARLRLYEWQDHC